MTTIHLRAMRHARARMGARAVALSTLLACLFGASCSDDGPTDQVVTRADPTVNFTAYHTFAIQTQVPPGVTIPPNVSTNLAALNQDASNELVKQGLVQVDPAVTTPDLWVFTLASTSESSGYVWECVPGQWWGYWGWTWDPCAWMEPVYTTFVEGTGVIGLSDAGLEKVVFGGVIRGEVTGELDSNRLANDVARVFDAYPATQTGTDAGTSPGRIR